jgi:hypothetical protein
MNFNALTESIFEIKSPDQLMLGTSVVASKTTGEILREQGSR